MPVLGLYCSRKTLGKEIENTVLALWARRRITKADREWPDFADDSLRHLDSLTELTENKAADLRSEKEPVSWLILSCDTVQETFETAEQLWKEQPSLPVIFIATQAEEVFEALPYPFFHVVRDYALEQDLQAVLCKMERSRPRRPRWRVFQCKSGAMRVLQKEILYLESDRHEIRVHSEKEVFSTSETLGWWEEMLKEEGFIRIHKSFLVNFYHVGKIEKDSLLLDNGERLFISRYRYPEVKARFESYMRHLEFL